MFNSAHYDNRFAQIFIEAANTLPFKTIGFRNIHSRVTWAVSTAQGEFIATAHVTFTSCKKRLRSRRARAVLKKLRDRLFLKRKEQF